MGPRLKSEDDTLPVSRRRRGRAATQAARSGNLPTSTRRKKTNKLYLVASVVIAVLVISSFAFASFSGGGGGVDTGSASSYVEGVGVEHDIMASVAHVPTGTSVEYSTTPPTSGDHWFDLEAPRACGFYEDGEALDEQIVHNLEHGNIVVSYNLTDESQVAELKSAMDGIGKANIWGVIRSYDKFPEGQVALSAWGVLDTMEGVDADRIDKFFETYAGALGPEFLTC
jgi:hypothetical protein